MTKTIQATFDGRVLHPDEPLPLPPNSRVTVTISVPDESAGAGSFLQTAGALELDGPEDWSENLDEYLYGQAGNAG